MKPTFDMMDAGTAFQIVRIAQLVVEAHDENEWDERTQETDFGDALDALRDALKMEKPER